MTPPKSTVEQRLRPTHCLQCKGPISKRSSYTFFCSKDCAAEWGDDEAMIRGSRCSVLSRTRKEVRVPPARKPPTVSDPRAAWNPRA